MRGVAAVCASEASRALRIVVAALILLTALPLDAFAAPDTAPEAREEAGWAAPAASGRARRLVAMTLGDPLLPAGAAASAAQAQAGATLSTGPLTRLARAFRARPAREIPPAEWRIGFAELLESGRSVSGRASWYPGTRGWHGRPHAAVPFGRWVLPGAPGIFRLRVCTDAGRCLVIPGADFCDCYAGSAESRLIDLSSEARDALGLAPAAGIYRVTITLVGRLSAPISHNGISRTLRDGQAPAKAAARSAAIGRLSATERAKAKARAAAERKARAKAAKAAAASPEPPGAQALRDKARAAARRKARADAAASARAARPSAIPAPPIESPDARVGAPRGVRVAPERLSEQRRRRMAAGACGRRTRAG